MSYIKRQELFNNVNPLLKKYHYDGDIPPSYIPPKKRKIIYRYMGRSSYNPGNFDPSSETKEGNISTKMDADLNNLKHTDFKKSLHERISDGQNVKNYQTYQRVYMGKVDSKEAINRQRVQDKSVPINTYKQMIEDRDTIKENTNKCKIYVNHNEPIFINSMSRTMDAFDLRMSTFGGQNAQNKDKNFDKFIQEKRGFIRITNGYLNNDPFEILRQEQQVKVQRPGPAFETSYNNQYPQGTSFASDKGRFKVPLNINQHDEEILKNAERSQFLNELKFSNIKFTQDEMGSPLLNKIQSENDEKKQFKKQFQFLDSASISNANSKNNLGAYSNEESQDPQHDEQEKKLLLRSRTSQRSRNDLQFKQVSFKSDAKQNQQLNTLQDRKTSIKYSPFKKKIAKISDLTGKKFIQRNYEQSKTSVDQETNEILKPYELWKKQLFVSQNSIYTNQNKDIKFINDFSSKAHLTRANGSQNQVDYLSSQKIYHSKVLQLDPTHLEMDKNVHKVMKTTTYKIGKEGESAPNEKISSTETYHNLKQHIEDQPPKFDKNSRRCDPENPNRILTVGFGHGWEKGTQEDQIEHRNKTYNRDQFQPKEPDMSFNLSTQIMKERNEFNLKNKFEYGFDVNGGANAGKEPDDENKYKECLDQSALIHSQREKNKEKLEKQNFSIHPEKNQYNSETKYIGNHNGKGIDNIIDQEDLKRSHVPIPQSSSDKMQILKNFYGSTNNNLSVMTKTRQQVDQMKSLYKDFKNSSLVSKVPFSPLQRNKLESNYQKFDKVNGYGSSFNKQQFSWKVPTYDLS